MMSLFNAGLLSSVTLINSLIIHSYIHNGAIWELNDVFPDGYIARKKIVPPFI